tara:strand:+ start:16107 stop:17342 length:1236 start_codon:yes stop_codon:yes gene_type:complete
MKESLSKFMIDNTSLILFRIIGGLFPTVTYLLLPSFTNIEVSASVVGILSIALVVSTLLRFGIDQYILKTGVNEKIGSSLIKTSFTQLIIFTLLIFSFVILLISMYQLIINPSEGLKNSFLQAAVVALPISILSIGFTFFASQAMKVTSIIFFNIAPYFLILLGVMIHDNSVTVLFCAFALPCLYLIKFIDFDIKKHLGLSVLSNAITRDLLKIYLVSVLAVLLTNVPVMFAMYLAIDGLIYSSGVFVRLIGLTSFISTIVYTLFARELRDLVPDLTEQLKIFFGSYLLLASGFTILIAIGVFLIKYSAIPFNFAHDYQVSDIKTITFFILLLPLITLGNIIGYRLLVTDQTNCLIIALGISNAFLIFSYSSQFFIEELGISMLYFYALVLDSIIKIMFYFYNLPKEISYD